MNDALAGRLLVFILALIFAISVVKDMSWENKWNKFIFRLNCVVVFMRGVAYFVFDVLGLFPFD